MKQNALILRDKEFISNVNSKYTFFVFPDGRQYQTRSDKQELSEVYQWLLEEMTFYRRMHEELQKAYEREKAAFDGSSHFYTEEEIYHANLYTKAEMEVSNEKYRTEWGKITGKGDAAVKASGKYWQLYKLAKQIQNVVAMM